MPVTDALILAAIVFVFAVFGIVLAWAEYQTRRLPPPESATSQYRSTTAIEVKTARSKEMVAS